MHSLFDLPLMITLPLAAVIGAILGSFTTCIIYRLPQRLPLWRGDFGRRSICTTCKRKLSVIDLFPILSWLIFRGRCRRCYQKISWLYPAIELSCAMLCMGIVWQFGLTSSSAILIATVPILVAIFVIDFFYKIIPDWLNLWLFLIGILWVVFTQQDTWQSHAIAAVAYPAFAYALRWSFSKLLKREAMGLGDVKFFAAAGLWLGLSLSSPFLMIAGLGGILLAGLKRLSSDDPEIPFGPALVLSFFLCLYFQEPILRVLQTASL